jgi:hypothetical protein
MAKCQLKGLFYNCDEKYFWGHKCKEQNIFMAISKDVSDENVDVPHVEEPPQEDDHTPLSNPPKFEPLISLNSLTCFSAPQALKLIGYIKNMKFDILVDSGNTHNVIHHHISQETMCYIHAIKNFQIMITNDGSMKCGGCCKNGHLQIGQYHLKYQVFAINMGDYDIMLGAEWLHTLSPITIDFKDLTMQFQ